VGGPMPRIGPVTDGEQQTMGQSASAQSDRTRG
jgi:hypothetical protein